MNLHEVLELIQLRRFERDPVQRLLESNPHARRLSGGREAQAAAGGVRLRRRRGRRGDRRRGQSAGIHAPQVEPATSPRRIGDRSHRRVPGAPRPGADRVGADRVHAHDAPHRRGVGVPRREGERNSVHAVDHGHDHHRRGRRNRSPEPVVPALRHHRSTTQRSADRPCRRGRLSGAGGHHRHGCHRTPYTRSSQRIDHSAAAQPTNHHRHRSPPRLLGQDVAQPGHRLCQLHRADCKGGEECRVDTNRFTLRLVVELGRHRGHSGEVGRPATAEGSDRSGRCASCASTSASLPSICRTMVAANSIGAHRPSICWRRCAQRSAPMCPS